MTDRLSSLSTSLLGVLRRVTGDAQLAYESDPVPLTGGVSARAVTFSPAVAPPRKAGPPVPPVIPERHRLDPSPIENGLDTAGVARPGLDTMLESLGATADALGRVDL